MRAFLTPLISDPGYRKLALRAAFLLYAAILVLGSIPGARAEVGEVAPGVVLHGTAYAIITMLLVCGTQGGFRTRACLSCLIVAAMGAVDEGVQSFFPYRTSSVADWLVDVHAALLTSVVCWLLWPKEVGKNSGPLP